jgi:hypothetical protein
VGLLLLLLLIFVRDSNDIVLLSNNARKELLVLSMLVFPSVVAGGLVSALVLELLVLSMLVFPSCRGVLLATHPSNHVLRSSDIGVDSAKDCTFSLSRQEIYFHTCALGNKGVLNLQFHDNMPNNMYRKTWIRG